jgi:hypothetical protein
MAIIKPAPGNPVNMPEADTDISYDVQNYWSFVPTDKSGDSDTYKDTKRSINSILTNDFGDTEYKNIELEEGNILDYYSYYGDALTNGSPDYFKIELSLSASSTKTNLYDNSLVGGFYVQDNKYFEIVGQEGGNIIDVASKDITKTSFLNPYYKFDYILIQEFGWKFKEWEMFSDNQTTERFDSTVRSTQRTFFFDGEIIATNKSNKMILVRVSGENQATISKEGYYNLGKIESISFYERFVEQYPHDSKSSPKKAYNKYQGWYTYSTTSSHKGINSYKIKNIFIEPAKKTLIEKNNYEIIIEFNEDPENFFVGDIVYCLFDKTPYQRQGVFRGTQLMSVEQIDPIDVNNRLCLDGFWLSPRYKLSIPTGTRLGLCGGRYWGIGERTRDNNYAIIFMRTPRSGLGITSVIHGVSNINYVFFYDYFTNQLSLRMGNLKYSEYPRKYSISVGYPSNTEIVTLSSSSSKEISIPLNVNEYATKLITFDSSEYPRGDSIMLFSIKDSENYYGTLISGEGDMKLLGFSRTEIDEEKEDYKYNGEIVSPVYEYNVGEYSLHKERDIYLSVETENSPIIVSSDSSLSRLSKAKIEYVKYNQHIDNSNFIDLIKTDYSEFLLIMGKGFPPFTVEGSSKQSNSSAASNKWDFQEGIFILGSRNLGGFWGTPGEYIDEDYEYGTLALDSVKYLCSIYHHVPNNILLFFVSTLRGIVYLGCLVINNSNLSKGLLKCEAEGDNRDFYWRPPLVPASSYTPNVSIEDSDESSSSSEEDEDASGQVKDEFVIIASESLKEAQIEAKNVTDFGNVSCSQLKDGRLILLYDSLDGINMLFSTSSGFLWGKSEIVLARNVKSGLYVEPFLFFLSSSGMYVKLITSSLLAKCMDAVEGEEPSFIEDVQREVDEETPLDLETGEIPEQKFSGSYNDFGIIQIYYYDSEGKLASVSGSGATWKKSQNF